MPNRVNFQLYQRFGRLVVFSEGEKGKDPGGKSFRTWICLCDCGKKVSVRTKGLTSGKTHSCGCAKQDVKAARARRLLKKEALEGSRKLAQQKIFAYFAAKEAADGKVS